MKKIPSLFLAICLLFSLAACGPSATHTETLPPAESSSPVPAVPNSSTPTEAPVGEKIELKLTTTDAASTIWIQQCQAACDKVYERTDGMVEIQIYPNGEMLVGSAGMEAVLSDAPVMWFTDISYFADYVPELATIYSPYLYESYQELEDFLRTDVAFDIINQAKAKNLHPVGDTFFIVGYRNVLSSFPITSLEDMKKLTTRIPNQTAYSKIFEAFGSNYVNMDNSQSYNALETGMINGVENTPCNLAANSMDEAIKTPYYSLTKHLLCTPGLFCGEGFWNSLPATYQTIITEEFSNAIFTSNQMVDEMTEDFYATLESRGVTIVEIEDLEPFRQAVQDYCQSLAGYDKILAAIEELRAQA